MVEKPVFDRDESYQAAFRVTREQGSQRDYSFAPMAEVLSKILFGALTTMLAPGSGSKRGTMDEMLKRLRTARPVPGQDRVLYPGLSAAEEVGHRRAHGNPAPQGHAPWLAECTKELRVARVVRMR
jgi:hypothetical protein